MIPELDDYLPQLQTFRAHRLVLGIAVREYATQVVELAQGLYEDQLRKGPLNSPGGRSTLFGLSWQNYCIHPPYPYWRHREAEVDFQQRQLQFSCDAAYALYVHGLCLPHAGEMFLLGATEGVYVEVVSRFQPAYSYFDRLLAALDDRYGSKSISPSKTASEVWAERNKRKARRKAGKRVKSKVVRDRIAAIGRLKADDPQITDLELAQRLRCSETQARYARRQWESENPFLS